MVQRRDRDVKKKAYDAGPTLKQEWLNVSRQTDRTGQDRTGQDRTGQDRTGQDRTGQDRTYLIDRKKVITDLFVIEMKDIYVHVYTRLMIC